MNTYSFFILYFIFVLIDKNQSNNINIEANFPTTLLLPSGNYFVLSSEGINVYNYNFNDNLFSYIFNESEKINNYNQYIKTAISNYVVDNNNFILCLTKGLFLYIFDSNNYTLKKVKISNIDDGKIYNLIPNKYKNNSIEYIVSYINFNIIGEYQIQLLLFELSFSEEIYHNFLIKNKSISNLNKNNNNSDTFELYLSCQKVDFSNKNLLICFYSSNYKKDLMATVFDIDENFKIKNSTSNHFYNPYNIVRIESSLSFNNTKIFACNNIINNKYNYLFTECALYDIKNNQFLLYFDFSNCFSFKIVNYNQINELNLVCYMERYDYRNSTRNKIQIIKFKKNFDTFTLESSFIEKIINYNISNCLYMNSFSLIYNNISQESNLISDCPSQGKYYITNHSDIDYYIPYYNVNNSLNEYESVSSTVNVFDYYTSMLSSTNSPIYTSELSSKALSTILYDFSPTDSLIDTNELLSADTDSPKYNASFPIKYKIDKSKEDIVNNITELIESIGIGKYYEIKGEDFTITIKPTNASYSPNSTHIDFKECEDALRNFSNIPSSKLLTIFQMELDNKDDTSLVNQVEYQIYDDNKKLLDLSICENIDIKVTYACKEDKINEIEYVNYFKDLGIDIFDINDAFFNDICHPYSQSDNDVTLKDRIKDLYRNFSLCNDGCVYIGIDPENKTISCNCKVKSNISLEIINSTLKRLDEIKVDSNFALIKCFNLVFSLKKKSKNVGFWLFLLLVLGHIPLLIWLFNKGIKPLKEYIFNEMGKYGYIDNKETKTNVEEKIKKTKSYKKNEEEIAKKNKKKKKSSKKNVSSPPPKHNSLTSGDNSSVNNIKLSEREIIKKINRIDINKEDNKTQKNNNINKEKLIINNNNDKRKIKKVKSIKDEKNSNKKKIKNNINVIQTQIIDKSGNNNENEENEPKKTIFNFNLININLNNAQEYTPQRSSHVLNNYTFKEAIEYDMRSVLAIFYIFLLSKQALCHAFLYRSPLELFPLRLCLLFFIISCDLALNAFFYLDDKISKKYKYAKNLFLFTFNSNITIILLSTLIGFVFMTLWTNLGNSTNKLRNVFRSEEEKIQQDEKYKVSKERKKEIMEEIEKILKTYKIKVIILLSIEISLMFFFWYYVTAFCHVYPSTQGSWILDSFLSMLTRLIIIIFLSMLFAKLYRMSLESNVECIYKFVLFFYSFG